MSGGGAEPLLTSNSLIHLSYWYLIISFAPTLRGNNSGQWRSSMHQSLPDSWSMMPWCMASKKRMKEEADGGVCRHRIWICHRCRKPPLAQLPRVGPVPSRRPIDASQSLHTGEVEAETPWFAAKHTLELTTSWEPESARNKIDFMRLYRLQQSGCRRRSTSSRTRSTELRTAPVTYSQRGE